MAKTMKLSKLKEQYEMIVSEYIRKFCNKQGLAFEHWAGDAIGGIACFGDIFYFNFSDIVFDINSRQHKGLIISWLYDSVDNPGKSINYFSYSKGLRCGDIVETKDNNCSDWYFTSEEEFAKHIQNNMPFAIRPTKKAKTALVNPFTSMNARKICIDAIVNSLMKEH